MVEIEPRSWLFLVFLLLLNFFRLSFMGSVYAHDLCYDYHHPHDNTTAAEDHVDDVEHRRLEATAADEEGDVLIHTCPDYIMWYAIVIGYGLLFVTVIVCIITHFQKQRLLCLAGVSTASDRVHKLKALQDKEKKAESEHYQKFKQLSVELSTRMKTKQSVWKKLGSSSFAGSTASTSSVLDVDDDVQEKNTDLFDDVRPANPVQENSRRMLQKQDSIFMEKSGPASLRLKVDKGSARDEDDKFYVSTLVVALGAVQRRHLRHHQEFAHKVLFWLKSICSGFVWNCITFRKVSSSRPQINEKLLESARNLRRHSANHEEDFGGSMRDLDMDMGVGSRSFALKHSMSLGSCESETESDLEDEGLLDHPLLKTIDSIFIFGNRNIYKYFIQLILMLDAFYLSLYVTNLISVSLESEHPIVFNLLMLGTVFIMSTLASYLLVVSSILFCVTSLNNKGTEWMCEQEEIKRKVLPILRREMLSFLDTSNDAETFFSLISGDGDIKLTDFADFLFTLGMYPSQKEIRALFRAVDVDASGTIDLNELKALLFEPTKAFGRNLEQRPSKTKRRNSKSKDISEEEEGERELSQEEGRGEDSCTVCVMKALSSGECDENGDICMTEQV
jgi:hypothetical protein